MDCKRILKEYLQDYQIAEEQLVPCLYQQKNCVCVILEKIGYRKSSGEPLPKIGIMIDVDTKKIIGEVSEMDFEKYHLYGKNEETESIPELKEVSAEKNKTICFYVEESKIEKIMKQFLPKEQEIVWPKENTNEMKVTPRV